ncbi:MAG: nitrogen fixation NifU-like protein [Kiritimatiellia bacterium]|jgi:nitrogen fixation protein NifU and related proteins
MNLDDLYQELILEHFKQPRHQRKMADDEAFEEAFNPNCGDKTRVLAQIHGQQVTSIEHDTKGCAISIASASIMCERLRGKTAAECREAIQTFIDGLYERIEPAYDDEDPLAALLTVKRFPMRIHCATLSWDALEKRLTREASDS